jgi:uncharacterized protein DUF5677
MKEQSAEDNSLAFASDLQVLLANALDSIAGKTTEAEISYLIWGASHVNKAAAGYSELRKRHMIHASKIMIRPVIETTAAVVAALKQPGFLFRKAYGEYKEDKNLLVEFRKLLEKDNQPTAPLQQQLKELERNWEQFNQHWIKTRPHVPKKSEKLRFPDVLHCADLGAWYAQYRIYCQFTHGALRAASGDLDEMTDPADNLVIAWLTLITLDQLKKFAPVEVPDLAPLWDKAKALMV